MVRSFREVKIIMSVHVKYNSVKLVCEDTGQQKSAHDLLSHDRYSIRTHFKILSLASILSHRVTNKIIELNSLFADYLSLRNQRAASVQRP